MQIFKENSTPPKSPILRHVFSNKKFRQSRSVSKIEKEDDVDIKLKQLERLYDMFENIDEEVEIEQRMEKLEKT